MFLPKKFLSFIIHFLLSLSLFAVHQGGTGVRITRYLYVNACKLEQSYKENKQALPSLIFTMVQIVLEKMMKLIQILHDYHT